MSLLLEDTIRFPKKGYTNVRRVFAGRDFERPMIILEVDHCTYLLMGSPQVINSIEPLEKDNELDEIKNPCAMRVLVMEHNDILANLCKDDNILSAITKMGIDVETLFVKTVEINGKIYDLYKRKI